VWGKPGNMMRSGGSEVDVACRVTVATIQIIVLDWSSTEVHQGGHFKSSTIVLAISETECNCEIQTFADSPK
jgi:hypothetical protein